jgi:predicted dehydrogenase
MMAASRQLRVALVGAGHMGRLHARTIAAREDAHLVAVCDVDAAAAAALADAHGARVRRDVCDLVGEVDAVVLAAATSAHRDLALSLIRAGIPLLVEKPLAGTAAEAREIARAAERAGAILQVGHILRFDPVTRALAGRTFQPTRIAVSWRSPFTGRSTDVSVVMDLAIHGIDLVLKWAGDMPEEVTATGRTVKGPHADEVEAHLEFAGGCVANLFASRVSETRERRIRITAGSETIELDYAARTVRWGSEALPVETGPDALTAQMNAFLAAVRGEAPVAVSADEGARAVEVADRIHEAVAKGQGKA